ncbi:unnamed protein product [Leptosia nina]|uniref:Myb-like domain-containing protein n=1 Tax=Leptosia nina TaxID=320188 RepID=A0AAV1JW95_9NEOP
MSTRRARIKAVTALPPRRKNAVAINNKPENEVKVPSPKATTSAVTNNTDTPTNVEPIESLKLAIETNKPPTPTVTPQISNAPTILNVYRCPTPKPNIQNVFASPLIRSSPKKTFASPNLPSPLNVARNIDITRTPIRQATPKHHEFNQNTELHMGSASINRVQQKSRIEVYNVSKIPENISNNAMDGIVPLQPARAPPKPIEKLKNDIISENAEVLFDPIVPLPSPNKVRPKLRPVPRLGPRRNSIQGSASESEDESRRSLLSGSNTPGPRTRHDSHSHSMLQTMLNREVNRVRNDSVCSSVSQATGQQTPASPLKDKSLKSRRAHDTSSRRATMAASRRRRIAKREEMTMYDLIYYNPSENPIIPDEDEIKAKEENAKELAQQKVEMKKEENTKETTNESAPAPQIKLGPNGEIVLDESSLVIQQTQNQKISSVVREGAWMPCQGKYKRAPRTADWTGPETVRFYRALAAIGTDFTLMAALFPDRTRKDLKLKFKKEEKLNGEQVDKALRSKISWNAVSLKEEFAEEREAAKRKAEEEKAKEKELYLQQKKAEKERIKTYRAKSRGLKALEVSEEDDVKQKENTGTVNELLKRTANAYKKVPPVNLTNNKSEQISYKRPIPITPVIKTSNSARTVNKTPTLAIPEKVYKRRKSNTTPGPTDMATITKLNTPTSTRTPELSLHNLPTNIETGSLIVLTVNDPKSPGKKMLQTYIAHEKGKLSQVALPSVLLNSVVGYMKKGTPKSTASGNSSPLLSPLNGDSRSSTPSVKTSDRIRNSSFSITEL